MTDPSVHGAEGDERTRTAVCDGTTDPEYEELLRAARIATEASSIVETTLVSETWVFPRGTMQKLRRALARAAVARREGTQ